MKKLAYAAGGLVGLAALWSAGWFVLKSTVVEPETELAVERMRQGNLFFSYDEKEIGGFPFAYDVAFTGVKLSDASALWSWSAKRMAIGSGVADGGALVARPAPASKLVVEAAALGGGAEDAPSVFDVTSDGLEITFDGAGAFAVAAAKLDVAQVAGGSALRDAALAFEALDARGRRDPAGVEGEVDLNAASLRIAYTLSFDGINENVSDTTMRDVTLSASSDKLGAASLTEFVALGGGAVVKATAGAMEGKSESRIDGQPGAVFNLASAESAFEVEIAEGRARYAGEARAMTYDMPASPMTPPAQMDIGAMKLQMSLPITRTEAPEPYAILIAVDRLAVGEPLWAMIDPGAAITRGPLDIAVDLGGEMQVLFDFGAETLGGPPADLKTLDINGVTLAGLGVDAKATGALKIAGNAAQPEGVIDVDLKGAFGLLDQIVAAGLLAPPEADFYKNLVRAYAREEAPDHLVARIEAQGGGVTINGQRLQ